VTCEGDADPDTGWLIDFAEVKRLFTPILDQLDHYYLNEIEGLENPTAENLARWIWGRLKRELPQLAQITIAETCTSRCEYRG
jgi:6-pyruvoyltetrahydropterin/6-carboxytetrahydropterin synthase